MIGINSGKYNMQIIWGPGLWQTHSIIKEADKQVTTKQCD